MSPPRADLSCAVVPQLLRLPSAAAYARWLAQASRARAPASLRLFASPALDLLSWTPWWAVPLLYAPAALALAAHGGAAALGAAPAAALFLLGMLAWSLVEYSVHRFVFHAAPLGGGAACAAAFLVHGVHHLAPADHGRLVFPPAASAPCFVALRAALRAGPCAGLGEPAFAALFAGVMIGYVCYDVS